MRNCIKIRYLKPIMVLGMTVLFVSISHWTIAQIRFKVEILPDSMTYQVVLLPDTTLVPPSSRTSTAQITILVPTPTTGGQGFEVANVTALLPSTSWSANSHYIAPEENPNFDYISFGLNSLGTLGIPYITGEEVAIFSFQNVGVCTGSVELFTVDDPFMPPNSLNANVGNQIATLGTGIENNAYTGNYGIGTANCLGEVTPMISDCLIDLELEQLNDGTYQVVFTPDTTWTSPNDSTLAARISLVAPTDDLQIGNLTNLQNNVIFSLSNVYQSPPDNPDMDYFVFNLSFPTTQLPYIEGEKVPLFKFINNGDCEGNILSLMNEQTDPFAMPNSIGAEVGQRWQTSALTVATPVCVGDNHSQALGINIIDILPSHPSDCGASDGALTIIISGSSAYEYSINNGTDWSTIPQFINLSANTYHVIARYPNGTCTTSPIEIQLNEADSPTVQDVLFTHPDDCNIFGGSITIISDNNDEYSIDNGTNWQEEATFSDLIGGTYEVLARTIGTNCQISAANINLNTPQVPEIVNIEANNATNCNNNDASIVITAACANSDENCNLEYSIDGGDTWSSSMTFSNVISNTYTAVVRILGSPCTSEEQQVSIENPISPVIDSVSLIRPVGCDALDGSIIVHAQCEENCVLEYSINNGETWSSINVFDQLAADTYQVLVRNSSNNCEETIDNIILTAENCCEVEYILERLEGERYQVSMLPQVTYDAPDNRTSTAQVTIVAPTGVLEIANLQSLVDEVIFEQNARINSPSVNPEIDYISFGLVTVGTENIPYQNGVKVPLFTFDNIGPCQEEDICLMNNEQDPFYPPNAQNANMGQQLTTLGGGVDMPICIGNAQHLAGTPYAPGEEEACVSCSNATCPSANLLATSTGPICQGESVQLTVFSSLDNLEYRWYYADSGALFSTQQNPTVSNLNTTTSFKVIAFSSECISDSSAIITVHVGETIDFTPSFSTEIIDDCIVESLQLFANLENDNAQNYQYWWTGPNDFTSSFPNPVLQQPTTAVNGSYILSITDATGCQATKTVQVENIQQGVLMPLITSTGPVCEGSSLTLSVDLYEGFDVDYIWHFPDSTHVTGWNTHSLTISPMMTDLHQGDYSVTVIVDGCTNTSDSYNLEVLEVTTVQPTVTAGAICEGSTVQLFANAPGATQYAWTGPNGFSSLATNPVIPNATIFDNGTYSLEASTISGCQYAGSINLTSITARPETPTIISNSPVCEDDTIRLRIQENYTSDNITYQWYNTFNQVVGTNADLAISVNAPNAQGPFRVQVAVNDCLSDYSNFISIDIITAPMAQASAANDGVICRGEELSLQANFVEQAQYKWRILNNPQIISTEQNPIIQNLIATTSFELSISLTGCSIVAKDTLVVSVETTPVIENLPATLSVCEGTDVVLSANNAIPTESIVQFTWTGPNNFSYSNIAEATEDIELEIPNIQNNAAGTYTLVLSANGCTSSPQSIVVQVEEALTTPSLNLDNNVLCEGQSLVLNTTSYEGQNITYNWYFSTGTDEFLLNSTNQPSLLLSSITPINSGFYSVQVTRAGCTSNRSALQEVWVFGPATVIEAFSNQDEMDATCEGTNIQLGLPFIPNINYQWFGPNNFTSSQANPLILNATAAAAGDYYAIVTLEGCASVVSQTTSIHITTTPPPPLITRLDIEDPNQVCDGQDLNLTIINPPTLANTDTVTYHWYFENIDTAFAITTVPTLSIANVNNTHSGSYYAATIFNGCPSNISEPFEVEIISINPNVDIADAGLDSTFCAANVLTLDAQLAEDDSGFWTSTTGAIFSDPTQPNSQVMNLITGENILVWTISRGPCLDFSSDTLLYQVDEVPVDIAYAGEDFSVCGDTLIFLNAHRPIQSMGVWTQSQEQIAAGVTFTNPNFSFTTVEGIVDTGFYTFTWTLYSDNCGAYGSDEVTIYFGLRPEGVASIDLDEFYTCGETEVILEGSTPPVGVQGTWSTNSTATINPTDSPRTLVSNLAEGEQFFTWSFSTDDCPNYSSDVISVSQETTPQANLDTISLMFNDTLTGLDVLTNDLFGGIDPAIIRESFLIKNYPDNGTLLEQEEGIISYAPQQNFFGIDTIVYEICNLNCTDADNACSIAMLLITVSGTSPSGECFVPNIISPNGDGVNDALAFGCIDDYPNNQLLIFNRWGTKIYETIAYRNEWKGEWEGKPLPAGVYYYVFKQDSNAPGSIQGHFSIFR